MQTASAVIIGDELLSGKVHDTNSRRLIEALRRTGVRLRRLVMVGDDPTEIAQAVSHCAVSDDLVFTSGGLGPTHDDCTIEGIARAFGCPVQRHPQLVALIESYLGERVNADALRMADVPEGATLIGGGPFPILTFRNIYILPGVPEIFAAKVEAIADRLVGRPERLQRVFVNCDESAIASVLRQVDGEFAPVKIGSYPRLSAPDHKVMITLEAANSAPLQHAVDRLLKLLPASSLVRVEADE